MKVFVTYVPAVMCYVTLLVSDVSSTAIKTYQCAERQILHTLDLPGFYWEKRHCSIQAQEQSLRQTECTVWDFGEQKGYHDCSDLQFSSPSSSYVLGTEIYPNEEAFPNFIINFVNITWNYMQYRLQVNERKQCHKVWFNSSISEREMLSISFSCRQLKPREAEENLKAELLVDVGLNPSNITAHAHYVLKVPSSQLDRNEAISLKDWFILVAVDISHKPNLLVHWPAVPDRYNVTAYYVLINGHEPKVVDLSFCRNGYCSCEVFAGYFARNVTISVQPVHKDCSRSCYSYSPVITLDTCLPLYFTLPAALVTIMIFIFIIFCVYHFCCTAPKEPPRVLFLFDATTQEHRRVVYQLAEYLKVFCGVNCLVDNIEIPRTKSQDPFEWLHKTIDDADTVLYIASPPSYMDIRYSEYPNVVYDALRLIQQRRTNQTDCRLRIRCIVAVPPYCSEENIPSVLLNVPRFYIPKELKWLLWYLYNRKCRVAPVTYMAKAYLRCCWCPGPMSFYRRHGRLLEEKLELAKAEKIRQEELPQGEPTVEGSRYGKDSSYKGTIYDFPGEINDILWSKNLEGSLASQESVESTSMDMDTMIHGHNTHKIAEEGSSKHDENIFVTYSHPQMKSDSLTLSGWPGGTLTCQDNDTMYNMCIDTLVL